MGLELGRGIGSALIPCLLNCIAMKKASVPTGVRHCFYRAGSLFFAKVLTARLLAEQCLQCMPL